MITLPPPWVAWIFLVAGWAMIYFDHGLFGVMLVVVFVALRVTTRERKVSIEAHPTDDATLPISQQGAPTMGFIQRLFGNKQRTDETREPKTLPASSDSATDEGDAGILPVLQPALEAFQAGNFPAALAAAQPHVGNADGAADANRLCALALSAMNRYPEAFGHWLTLFELEPGAHNALQLATCSVMCDEIERGEAWLMKFRHLNADTQEMQSVAALVNFISALTQHGRPDRAIPHLDDLKQVYIELRTTDPTPLFMNGVPFFGEFLQRSLPILQSTLDPDAVRSWYADLNGQLDEAGQAALEEWLAALPTVGLMVE